MKQIVFLLSLMALTGVASAQDGASVPGGEPGVDPAPAESAPDRDVPDPPVPGLEMLPDGLVPGSWKTWATGQEGRLSTMPGFRINTAFDFLPGLLGAAGNGEGAPDYGEAFAQGMGVAIEAQYQIMPALSVCIGFEAVIMSGRSFEFSPDQISTYGAEFESGATHKCVPVGIRLNLPLMGDFGDLFKMGKVKNPSGLVLFTKFGLGLCLQDSQYIFYDDYTQPGPPYPRVNTEYWEPTTNPLIHFALGLEYRGDLLGACIALRYLDLGQPKPAPGLFNKSAQAENLRMMGISLEFSLDSAAKPIPYFFAGRLARGFETAARTR